MRFASISKHRFATAGAVLLAGIATGCDRNSGKAAAAGGFPPALVVTTPAVARDVPFYLDEIGKTVAKEVVEIRPQVSGRILQVEFEDGTEIYKNQPLFKIEPASYEAALAQAKAAFDQNQAQLALAKLDFERIKDLPRSVVSQQDFDAKKSAIDVAQAQVNASKAQIKVATVKVGYTSIISPLAGRAGQRLVDEGNIVSDTNPTSMLVIQNLDPIYADFTVTEADVSEVRRRMSEGTLRVEVRLPEDNVPYYGDLTFLDNSVQDGSGTVKLRATVSNTKPTARSVVAAVVRPIVALFAPGHPVLTKGVLRSEPLHFWPGQFVRVRLVLYTKKGATLVPSTSIQVGQKGPYLYVVNPDSTAKVVNVVLGQRQGDNVVIQDSPDGLKPGDHVIVSGTQLVMPGGPVREAPPEPGAATPGAGASRSAAAGPGQPTTKPAPKSAKEGGTK